MKKKLIAKALTILIVGCIAASTLVLSACSQQEKNAPSPAAVQNTALVIHDLDGNYLFVDTETGTPFVPTLTEAEITNISGKAVSIESLAIGDFVDITGDGAMTMSYPAQYPGITQVHITSRGNLEEVAEYSNIIASIYPATDENEVPVGWLNYDTSMGNITLSLSAYSTQGFTNNNGDANSQITTDSAVDSSGLINTETPDAHFAGDRSATVGFSRNFESATIGRIPITDPLAERLSVDIAASQESVPATVIDNGELAFTIEANYLYTINVNFSNGQAHYAFVTLSI